MDSWLMRTQSLSQQPDDCMGPMCAVCTWMIVVSICGTPGNGSRHCLWCTGWCLKTYSSCWIALPSLNIVAVGLGQGCFFLWQLDKPYLWEACLFVCKHKYGGWLDWVGGSGRRGGRGSFCQDVKLIN